MEFLDFSLDIVGKVLEADFLQRWRGTYKSGEVDEIYAKIVFQEFDQAPEKDAVGVESVDEDEVFLFSGG